MEIIKHYDDLTGKMIECVTLEDAMAMADEVRQEAVREVQAQMSKCMDEMEIKEIVAKYVE
jgi:hypothetical protein